ncbi:hypothetical protein ACFLYU_00880, partial [Candidatus Dependentiae bacterium]
MINLSYFGPFFVYLENFIGNETVILVIASLSFFIKLYLIIKLLSNSFKHKKTHASLSLLIIFIGTAMIADSAWIFKLARELLFPFTDYRIALFWFRIAWAFNVIQFHSLALFIESLIKNKKLMGLRQKIYIPITLTISLVFFSVAITQFNNVTPVGKDPLLITPYTLMELINFYPFNIVHNLVNNQLALNSILLILTTVTIYY